MPTHSFSPQYKALTMDNQLNPNWNIDMGATPLYEVPPAAAASVVAFDGDVSSNGVGFAFNSDDRGSGLDHGQSPSTQ